MRIRDGRGGGFCKGDRAGKQAFLIALEKRALMLAFVASSLEGLEFGGTGQAAAGAEPASEEAGTISKAIVGFLDGEVQEGSMMSKDSFDEVMSLNARLANLRTEDGYAVGVEMEGGVLNLTATGAALGMAAPRDMDDLLQHGLGEQVRAIREALVGRPEAAVVVASAEVQFAPLVTRPQKIVCVGFNYKEHAEETGTPIPKAPPLFAKFNNALNGHHGVVKLPVELDSQFDYETELVLVFGRRCHQVKEEDALEYVAGYSIGNDVSARKLQQQTSQFTAGKISDGFAPVGPWLVTRDRIADPNDLRLETYLNGEQKQNWTTRDMIYNCRKLISFLAGILTIEPGDLLFTGTPQGVILGEKMPAEMRRWIKPRDEVVSVIEGLGELRVSYE